MALAEVRHTSKRIALMKKAEEKEKEVFHSRHIDQEHNHRSFTLTHLKSKQNRKKFRPLAST